MGRLACGVVAVAVMILSCGLSLADGRPVIEMLRRLPEDPTTYLSFPLFSYVDFRAVEAAAGVGTPESEKALGEMPEAEQEAWRQSLLRIQIGPRSLFEYLRDVGRHEVTSYDATGPEWFTIDRAMAVWDQPPHRVTILGGDDDMTAAEGFDTTLPPRGFVLEDIDGVSVWSRFADNAFVPGLKDTAIEGDIFDDGLMTSLRLAVLNGTLIAAKAWPDLRAMLAVEAGAAPRAAAADLLTAMIDAVAAIEGGDGPIIQAMAFTLVQAGLTAPGVDLISGALQEGGSLDLDALAASIMETPAGPALPAYPLALFVDLAAGNEQLNVIVVPFPDRATAEAAAGVLAERLNGWRPGRSDETVLARIGGRLSTTVVEDVRVAPAFAAALRGVILAQASLTEGEADGAAAEPTGEVAAIPPGGAVTLIAIRYPLPEKGSGKRPAALFSAVLQAINNRDFTPFAVP